MADERKIEILRVLVGSHAHGLATTDSDRDFRSVYVVPTSELLRVDASSYKGAHTGEEKEDDTQYEIGHFLRLAIKSNPSVLEVFKAPILSISERIGFSNGGLPNSNLCFVGQQLRDLFPHVWNSKDVLNSHLGYSKQQEEKLLSGKIEVNRQWKFAIAYIRILLQGIELLTTNDFHIEVQHTYDNIFKPDEFIPGVRFDGWKDFLMAVRQGYLARGEIIDIAMALKEDLKSAFDHNPDKQTNLKLVNEFLLKVRKELW